MIGAPSFWRETVAAPPARPALRGAQSCDVAVIGGGFTGLWSAILLKEAQPDLGVTIVEQAEVGFGASGRNGGFAMTLLDLSLADLLAHQGAQQARRAHVAAADAVEAVGRFIADRGIDCDWRHGGLMVVATNATQMSRIEADLSAADQLGLDGFTPLSGPEARERLHSPTYRGGYHEAHAGVLNPLKLVHGLAAEAERLGVRILERSPVTIDDGGAGGVRLLSEHGSVAADQVVVTTNAWAGQPGSFRETITPLYTYILMTEPLDADQWERIGWEDHCGVEDKRGFVHYYRRTADGRILWGGSDGVIYRNGSIHPRHDTHDGIARRLQHTFRATFPQLRGVRFTHHWGGPVALTRRMVPAFGTTHGGRVHHGFGYCGHGVGPSHLGGRILRDKVLGADTDLMSLCFVDADAGGTPPYPLRWAGSVALRRAVTRQDDREERRFDDVLPTPWAMRVLH